MLHNSLTFRLIVTSFAWVGTTLVVTGILLIVLFRGHIEQRFEGLLLDHIEELVSAIELTPEGGMTMTWRPADPRFSRPHSGWYWEIRRAGVSIAHSDSLWRDSLKMTEPPVGEAPQIQQFTGPENEMLLALSREIVFPENEQPLLVVVAGPLSDVEENVRAFTSQVSITLTVLGIGLLLAVWFQVRFGLRPLKAMQQALGDIRKGEARRLPENYPKEIEPVVDELNGLLNHNEALLERARTQVGNLAHALKNPLTVIRNEAKAIGNEHGDVIRDQTAAMANSMDRYLSQARVAGTLGVLGARSDVKAIVEDLRFSLNRLYNEKGLEIQYEAPEECWFQGEAEDLEEVLGNLMDNACKWAVREVQVRAWCTDDRLLIVVEDDGPGIPERQKGEALGRGIRLDEKMHGSGLGLDIAQDIVRLYRGSISLNQAFNGGLSVHIDLPSARKL
jgi:signal transduction histidine kinase